jgi:hypothetical protein
MAYWEFKGRELINCSCDYGCNCQFTGLPDKGHCHAVAAIQIDEGQHGETREGLVSQYPAPSGRDRLAASELAGQCRLHRARESC